MAESIHRWDKAIAFKALLIGAAIETVAIVPAAFSPWGHAGPESILGWLGLLLNVPGLFVVWLLRAMSGVTETVSVVNGMASVYLIQTLIFSYLAFLWLRWKKLRVSD